MFLLISLLSTLVFSQYPKVAEIIDGKIVIKKQELKTPEGPVVVEYNLQYLTPKEAKQVNSEVNEVVIQTRERNNEDYNKFLEQEKSVCYQLARGNSGYEAFYNADGFLTKVFESDCSSYANDTYECPGGSTPCSPYEFAIANNLTGFISNVAGAVLYEISKNNLDNMQYVLDSGFRDPLVLSAILEIYWEAKGSPGTNEARKNLLPYYVITQNLEELV